MLVISQYQQCDFINSVPHINSFQVLFTQLTVSPVQVQWTALWGGKGVKSRASSSRMGAEICSISSYLNFQIYVSLWIWHSMNCLDEFKQVATACTYDLVCRAATHLFLPPPFQVLHSHPSHYKLVLLKCKKTQLFLRNIYSIRVTICVYSPYSYRQMEKQSKRSASMAS